MKLKLKLKLFIFIILSIVFIFGLNASKIQADTNTSSLATNQQLSIHDAHAYPNPFDNERQVAKIKFKIHVKKMINDVSIAVIIYDFNGKKVWTKRGGPINLNTGYNDVEVQWGGDNDMGDRVANGLYFAKIIIEGSNTKIKVVKILVK
ncbi:MAG: T9SS type A sorting domain-containing protein [Spirochaetes bacterium]|nr:T9SS type A sorting domain-containing protein [Spirochaetota bacterium]